MSAERQLSDFNDVPYGDRPREKLQRFGASALTESELVAILLNTGIAGKSVMHLASELVAEFGLIGLHRADLHDLLSIKGLGEKKAITLKAAVELADRIRRAEVDGVKITGPGEIFDLLGLEMMALEQEQLRVLLLDTRHRVKRIHTVYQGSANMAPIQVREVFREAVRFGAVAIVIVHNHPSGDPAPSAADVAVTAELVEAGKLLDIDVVDHVIIGHGVYVSMKRLGLGFGKQ